MYLYELYKNLATFGVIFTNKIKIKGLEMENLKNVYLGEFELTQILDEDYYEDDEENPQEYVNVFVNVEDDEDYYEADLFMRANQVIEGIGEIHGVMSLTNTCSIVAQFDEDDNEVVKLWKIC